MRTFIPRLTLQNSWTVVLFQLISPMVGYFPSSANKSSAAQFTAMWVRSRRATAVWNRSPEGIARASIIDALGYRDGEPGFYSRLFAGSRGARGKPSRFRAIGTYLRSGSFTARFAAHRLGKRRSRYPPR